MQEVLGALVMLAALAALAGDLSRALGRRRAALPRMTHAGRRAVMLVLSAAAALSAAPALFPPLRRGIFAICASCPVLPTPGRAVAPEQMAPVLERLLSAAWYYGATVLPVFVLACLLSGVIMARSDRFRVVGFWRSFGLAALLPLCSCGAVPIGKALVVAGDRGRRDGLVFIAAAPLLSPVILVLAVTAIGPLYALIRVVAAAALAYVMGAVVAPLVRTSTTRGNDRAVVLSTGPTGSALEAGLDNLRGLIRYALYGVAVGAVFTAVIPAEAVRAVMRPGLLSMAAAVVVGVPVNMCGGEEVLLTAPLLSMGLGLGHAIAFALAGTGICLSSMPMLAAALGRRATLGMVGVYVVAPFAMGLLLNAIQTALAG